MGDHTELSWKYLSEGMVYDHPGCLHIAPSTDTSSWRNSGFLCHYVYLTEAAWMTEACVLQPG